MRRVSEKQVKHSSLCIKSGLFKQERKLIKWVKSHRLEQQLRNYLSIRLVMRTKKPHININSFIWAHWHFRSDVRFGIPRSTRCNSSDRPDYGENSFSLLKTVLSQCLKIKGTYLFTQYIFSHRNYAQGECKSQHPMPQVDLTHL